MGIENEEVIAADGSLFMAKRVDGLYKCPLCGRLFYNPSDLIDHLIQHAKSSTTPRE